MELRALTVAVMQKNDCCVLCRKTELTFLVLGFWTLYFKSRKSDMHCMEHWAKKIRNIAPKFVQNTFGHFWKRLKAFFEFRNFFVFFENFRRLDLPWNTGQKNFFKKITPKHVQNTFEHFWERFWVFMEFWSFFNFFLKSFQDSTLRGTVGKNFFFQKSPKRRLDTWERFGQFRNFEIFLIFSLNFFYVFTSKFESGKLNSFF